MKSLDEPFIRNCHSEIMNTRTIVLPLALGTIIGVACDLAPLQPSDSCDMTGGLYQGLTPEQKQSCSECGAPDCGNETGDDAGDGDIGEWKIALPLHEAERTFALRVISDQVNDNAFGQLLAEIFPGWPAYDWGDWVTVDQDDCPASSVGWANRDYTYIQDEGTVFTQHFCNLEELLGDLPHATTLAGVTMCLRDYPRKHYEVGSVWPENGSPDETWPTQLECFGASVPAGSCALGPVRLYGAESYGTDSCRCDSDHDESGDLDCQDGAVCEGGYVIENGFPKATFCIWDDESAGDPPGNGFLPDGAAAYGFDDLAELVRVEADRVELHPRLLARIFTRPETLFNDDQRFELTDEGAVELTYCGPEALCSVLGLMTGDIVFPPHGVLDTLAGLNGSAVGEVEVLVTSGNTERLITVALE